MIGTEICTCPFVSDLQQRLSPCAPHRSPWNVRSQGDNACSSHLTSTESSHEAGNCPSHQCHLTLSESSRQLCPYPATTFRYRAAKKHVVHLMSRAFFRRRQCSESALVVFLQHAQPGPAPQLDHLHVADLVARIVSDASSQGSKN